MKIHLIYILLFITLFSVPAQSQVKIGSVNMAVIYNFHPMVQKYIPDEECFMKVDSNKEIKDIAEKNSSLILKLTTQIGQIYIKIKDTEKRFHKIDEQAYRDRRRIETDIESIQSNPANKNKKLDFSKEENKIKEIEKEKKENILKLNLEIAELKNKSSLLNDKIRSLIYYTGEEHKKVTEKIVNEVNEVIAAISRKKGLSVILNSTQFNRQIRAKKNKKRILNLSSEAVSSNIYRDKEYSVKQFLSGHTKDQANYAKDALDNNMKLYADMMEESEQFARAFADYNLNSQIIAGGIDITNDVMTEILNKYNVDKSIIQLISLGIKSKKIY